MAATTKLTMLIDMSNKLFNNKLSQMQNRFSGTVDKLKSKWNGFLERVPMLGGMLDKLKGPLMGLGVGLAVAVGSGLVMAAKKGIESAKQFDEAFYPIRNLNLDKSKSELDEYRSKIRDAAFEIGANLVDSTTAVHNLQSATGIYGDDAISIFKKVGVYSIATGATMEDAMDSTTKAIKAFGLEVKDIDDLLESNAKTVAVAITTFDELAKVQTVYAGAASSSGQTLDSANKVFAMFTSIAKNSNVASQMTKTFFEGLGMQAENIKEVLNIDVFDEFENMRQADDILKGIAKRFSDMTNKEITEAINAIGGPQGLRNALSKVATGAEDMISVFDQFDSMTFSMADAMKNAEGDVNLMRQMFQNRLDALLSKFGEKFFPMIAKVFDYLNPVLNWLYDNFETVSMIIGVLAAAFGVLTLVVIANAIAMYAHPIGLIIAAIVVLVGVIAIAIKKYDEWGAAVLAMMGPFGLLINAIKSVYDHWESIKKAFQSGGIIEGLKRIGIVLLDALLKPMQELLEMLSKIPGMGGLAAKGASKIEEIRERLNLITPGEVEIKVGKVVDNKSLYETENEGDKDKDNDDPLGLNGLGIDKLKDGVNKVTGDARQVKNITINIDSLNKGGINMNPTETGGLSLQEVEDWFNQAMMRIMRNAELS